MKNKFSVINKTGLLFIATTISLCIVGYSAAAWNGGLIYRGSLVTGNIDPIFSGTSSSVCSPYGKVEVDIGSTGGKSMSVRIIDAQPGTQAEINYTVMNRGSVPVRVDNDLAGTPESDSSTDTVGGNTGSEQQDIVVVNQFPDGVIDGNNGTGQGKLTITVNKIDNSSTLNFDLGMVFAQWNAVDNGELQLVLQ